MCVVVRTEQYKFQRLSGIFAIRTVYDYIVILFTANFAKQVNDNEISFYRTGIKSLEIAFKRLSDGQRAFNDHIYFFLNQLFN